MSQTDKPAEEKPSTENDDSNKCRECGEIGHMSYNCPKVKCYNWGEYGHKSYDCKKNQRGYQRGGRGRYRDYRDYRDGYGYGYGGGYGKYHRESKCYNCGKYGHKSFECDKPKGKNCYVCGKPGHISADCPEKK